MALSSAKPRSFSVDDYAKMIDAGVFRSGERVELIEGSIVAMAAHNLRHSMRMTHLTTLFVLRFHETHDVRVQQPLTLGTHSEPEPDFAIVPTAVTDGATRHPAMADLVLEISDSSLRFDRREKSSLYAKAGIQDYWLLNLKGNRLEVRRGPAPNSHGVYGWDYGHTEIFGPERSVAPLFRPDCQFTVQELLGR